MNYSSQVRFLECEETEIFVEINFILTVDDLIGTLCANQ